MALEAISATYTVNETINRNTPTRIFSTWEHNQLKRIQVNYNTGILNDYSTKSKINLITR